MIVLGSIWPALYIINKYEMIMIFSLGSIRPALYISNRYEMINDHDCFGFNLTWDSLVS